MKIAYDDAALYLIFRVEDQYVRAVTNKYQGSVCSDSCVEFFFTPGADVSQGYFNLEMNCGGTSLFCFQRAQGTDVVEIPEDEFDKITKAHSLPHIVDPEITTPGHLDGGVPSSAGDSEEALPDDPAGARGRLAGEFL